MRSDQYTLTPATVRALAHQTLAHALAWRDIGSRATAYRLLDLVLLAAALASSVSALVKRFRFGFSHETARNAIAANLRDPAHLTRHLLDALHRLTARAVRRRRWVLAIDEHRDPFYGDRSTPGITGGQKKHGTTYAFAYATAVLVHRRARFTVGLLPLTGGHKPHRVVETLLNQVRDRGLRIRGVVLDSGFDSGDTLLLLQGRGLSYSVPLRRKGNGRNARNALWESADGTIAAVSGKTDVGNRPVTTAVVVRQRRGEPTTKVYAFGGWSEREGRTQVQRARRARRWYRKRFGIESSYRQMREGKARTTATDGAYRLLLVGVALVLRQAWVWLSRELARQRGLPPSAWVGELSLRRMLDWLADAVRSDYKEEQGIPLDYPLPPINQAA